MSQPAGPAEPQAKIGGFLAEEQEVRTQLIALDALRVEEGVQKLLDSPDMKPYLDLAAAAISGRGLESELKKLSSLPLEKRYTWRVVSALKWALADFDDLGVRADVQTLSENDLEKVANLLERRPVQFCLFLSALFGPDDMERLMIRAIGLAKSLSISQQ
jgi:hypothetical protein